MSTKSGDGNNKSTDKTTGKPDAAPAGKPDEPKTGTGEPDDGESGEKKFTQADIDAALARDRQERKRAAKTTPPASKKDKPGDDADDEEKEKFRRRAEEAEAKLRANDARDALEKAAKDAGFANPAKIYRLLKDDLSFDDSGKPDNVKDLITIAKRDFPEELAARISGSADAGAGKGSGGVKSSMNDFIRRATGRG